MLPTPLPAPGVSFAGAGAGLVELEQLTVRMATANVNAALFIMSEPLDLLQQPLHRSPLQFEIFRSPQGVDGVSRRREDNPSSAVVVGPAGDRFRAKILVLQAIHI